MLKRLMVRCCIATQLRLRRRLKLPLWPLERGLYIQAYINDELWIAEERPELDEYPFVCNGAIAGKC